MSLKSEYVEQKLDWRVDRVNETIEKAGKNGKDHQV